MSTVSIERTSRKYVGAYARGYEARRRVQIRWRQENEIIGRMLESASDRVLDCPVGTGRFFDVYRRVRAVRLVYGVDVSEDMLRIARRKIKKDDPIEIFQGNVLHMNFNPREFHTTVCVRFLDLIDETALRHATTELCRLTSHQLILTIRLGEKYVPKSNTATHSRRKFVRMTQTLGFVVVESVKIFDQGWHVMRLERTA